MAKIKRNSSSRNQDPHRAREQKKYANPIPSREFIIQVLEQDGPLDYDQVATALKLSGDEPLEALRRRLKAMARDGQLVVNRRGAYCIVNKRDLIAGRVIAHPDGFGFLKPDEEGDDLFLSAREMRSLWHDDRAVARVTGMDRRGRLEGAIVEILQRNTQSVVGRLHCETGVGFVVPDNKRMIHDIIIPREGIGGATQGQIVVAEIREQPTKRTQPIGRIAEVLGEHMAPGMETDIAIRAFNVPVDWPGDVLQEIKTFGEQVPEAAKEGREDLRSVPLVTIDGEDARDFDDAVYCERKPKGWRLLVSIADVSAYVEPGTALDAEGYERSTSVYFPDRVVPMLPEVLSNGLCSLNPQVDRLCMTCELYINQEGKITRSRFYQAVMRSHARLTYNQVAAMLLDGDPQLCEKHADLLPQLHELYALYQVLHSSRQDRGAIDFDTTETKFRFDAMGKIAEVLPLVRNDAHKLIEECMLAANVAAARLFERKRLPALYRVHQGPKEEKLSDLREFLGELGLSLPGGDKPEAKDYAALMQQIKTRPDQHLVQAVMLRSLSQAVYSPSNLGHFGLAYQSYTHFTSPIRRYPDLLVHRAIKHLLEGGKADDFEYSLPRLQAMGEHCSANERRADEATRDAEAWLKCEYMQDKLGEQFDGTISGVSSFGFFVELDGVHVDGLVHITALDNDFYHFEPIGHRLTGERTGTVYRLGDRVRIQVAQVNLDDRKIDFVLTQTSTKSKPKPRRRRRR